MAGMKELSDVNMVSLVREILVGKDLSQVTARTVREEVILRLGNEVASDMAALKTSVKSALDVVLTEALNEQEERDPAQPPVIKKDVDRTDEKGGEKEAANAEIDPAESKKEEMDGNIERASESEEEDEEPVQRSKRSTDTAKRAPPQRPKKRSRVSDEEDCLFKSERDLNRLKRVCRQIGCTVPPSRQKGSNNREKCANVLGFLRSKGVTDRDPTQMRKEEISAHRRRIEREKDLEGLDVSNIIEKEGRSRRRKAAAPVPQTDELPSDLSGPELSEHSDDEGEEYAISDADSD